MPKPPLLPRRAPRAARVRWLLTALGTAIASELAPLTDRAMAALYRTVAAWPDDHPAFTATLAAPTCLRCGASVHQEVHHRCDCGTDRAILTEEDWEDTTQSDRPSPY